MNGLFRLVAGPFNGDEAASALQSLREGQYPGAYFTNKNLCG
ncbi:MAG: hypothetical protein U5L01_09350 [Rheinheimera sp.]|nr:hypothetical protein [Rheinheimera sp.]